MQVVHNCPEGACISSSVSCTSEHDCRINQREIFLSSNCTETSCEASDCPKCTASWKCMWTTPVQTHRWEWPHNEHDSVEPLTGFQRFLICFQNCSILLQSITLTAKLCVCLKIFLNIGFFPPPHIISITIFAFSCRNVAFPENKSHSQCFLGNAEVLQI